MGRGGERGVAERLVWAEETPDATKSSGVARFNREEDIWRYVDESLLSIFPKALINPQ